MARHCRLKALGIANCLGVGTAEVWPRLVGGDVSRLSIRTDFVPDRELLLAAVNDALPEIPEPQARYASRNNALCLAALHQITNPLEAVFAEVGAERVAVVMGTSTSGVSDAEAAIRHQHETDQLAPQFDYAQR